MPISQIHANSPRFGYFVSKQSDDSITLQFDRIEQKGLGIEEDTVTFRFQNDNATSEASVKALNTEDGQDRLKQLLLRKKSPLNQTQNPIDDPQVKKLITGLNSEFMEPYFFPFEMPTYPNLLMPYNNPYINPNLPMPPYNNPYINPNLPMPPYNNPYINPNPSMLPYNNPYINLNPPIPTPIIPNYSLLTYLSDGHPIPSRNDNQRLNELLESLSSAS